MERDRGGRGAGRPGRGDLRAALTGLSLGGGLFFFLAGAVALRAHDPITAKVYFNREIVAILERRCLSCHADNDVGMPLVSYRQVRPWAQAIKEAVLERSMPPWSALPGYGKFRNENRLTPREIDFLVAWVDGGAPATPEDRLAGTKSWFYRPELAASVPDPTAWPAGPPGLVLSLPPHRVQAGRGDYRERFRLPLEPGRAKWLRGLDFRPGDERVVRAAFFFLADGTFLGAWTPWQGPYLYPEGASLPLRDSLEVEIHYRSTRQEIEERSRVALYLQSQAPEDRLFSARLETEELELSPGQAEQLLTARYRTAEAVRLLALFPDLGEAGSSLAVLAIRPDGQREFLLWVKPYRAAWPTPYILREPVLLPAGTEIRLLARFTNGAAAPRLVQGRLYLSLLPEPNGR